MLGDERTWAPPPLRPYRAMVINVALTGAVPTKAVNSRLPVTPEEIARDAADCVAAGASVVHLHVRDEREHPVHRRDLYERTLGLIRERVPDVIVCVTTSSRVGADLELRLTGL